MVLYCRSFIIRVLSINSINIETTHYATTNGVPKYFFIFPGVTLLRSSTTGLPYVAPGRGSRIPFAALTLMRPTNCNLWSYQLKTLTERNTKQQFGSPHPLSTSNIQHSTFIIAEAKAATDDRGRKERWHPNRLTKGDSNRTYREHKSVVHRPRPQDNTPWCRSKREAPLG